MRRGVTMAAALAVAALWVPAAADARTIKSEVAMTGLTYGVDTVGAYGLITSPRAACLTARKVTVIKVNEGSPMRLFSDSSSLNGYWGGVAESLPPDLIRVTMKAKRIRKGLRCSSDSELGLGSGRALPRATYPADFNLYQQAYAGGQVGGAGNIETAPRCRSRRTVKAFDFDDGDRGRFRGKDVSSRNGYFGAFGKSNSEGVALVAAKKKLRPGQTCAAARHSYDPDPN